MNGKTPYPERPRFFAHRFVRVLHKSCAAQDIGPAACYLCCVIAHTEDAGRYRGPARFWRSQLMETLGFKSPKQLGIARDKAIQAGWLVYSQAGTRAVGEYFVTIPERFSGLPDSAIEPADEDTISSAGGTNGSINQPGLVPLLVPLETHKRNIKGNESGTPPIPIPIPIPTQLSGEYLDASSRKGRKTAKWPDLSPFDLSNPNDIANVHTLLASLGIIHDGHDGLRIVALAAVMALRLAKHNPLGYFRTILQDGFSKFGPADHDREAAKEILRELDR